MKLLSPSANKVKALVKEEKGNKGKTCLHLHTKKTETEKLYLHNSKPTSATKLRETLNSYLNWKRLGKRAGILHYYIG